VFNARPSHRTPGDGRLCRWLYDSTKAFHDLFAKDHLERALKLLSATPDELATRLLGSPRQSWATDSTALIKTPLLRLGETQYVCPDLHMFRAFLVQGIFELLMEAMDPNKLKQYLGGLFERYIERLMLSFAPTSSVLVNTYFNPVEFVSEGDQEAADGMLLWQNHAVLLECKTSMLTTRQRYAMSLPETTKAIDDQIATFQKLGEKKPGDRNKRKGIGQLAYNLARILAGEQVRHNGKSIDLSEVKKFYPAVVIYDEGMANHAVLRLFARKVRSCSSSVAIRVFTGLARVARITKHLGVAYVQAPVGADVERDDVVYDLRGCNESFSQARLAEVAVQVPAVLGNSFPGRVVAPLCRRSPASVVHSRGQRRVLVAVALASRLGAAPEAAPFL